MFGEIKNENYVLDTILKNKEINFSADLKNINNLKKILGDYDNVLTFAKIKKNEYLISELQDKEKKFLKKIKEIIIEYEVYIEKIKKLEIYEAAKIKLFGLLEQTIHE